MTNNRLVKKQRELLTGIRVVTDFVVIENTHGAMESKTDFKPWQYFYTALKAAILCQYCNESERVDRLLVEQDREMDVELHSMENIR